MAGRQPEPLERPSIAAAAASLVLAAWCSSPALAAPSVNPQCDDVVEVSLEIPVHDLSAEVTSHDASASDGAPSIDDQPKDLTPARYLVPGARDDAREALRDVAAPVADVVPPVTKEVATPPQGETGPQPHINTRLPGVSDDDLERYRQQMYRTDI